MATIAVDSVTKQADRCGGNACLRDLRIPVWAVVQYRRPGASDSEILRAYPSFKLSDLDAAWAYAAKYPEETEEAIRCNEDDVEGDAV